MTNSTPLLHHRIVRRSPHQSAEVHETRLVSGFFVARIRHFRSGEVTASYVLSSEISTLGPGAGLVQGAPSFIDADLPETGASRSIVFDRRYDLLKWIRWTVELGARRPRGAA